MRNSQGYYTVSIVYLISSQVYPEVAFSSMEGAQNYLDQFYIQKLGFTWRDEYKEACTRSDGKYSLEIVEQEVWEE